MLVFDFSSDSEFRSQYGVGYRVQGTGCKVQGTRYRVQGKEDAQPIALNPVPCILYLFDLVSSIPSL
jgi:hypothetical protein